MTTKAIFIHPTVFISSVFFLFFVVFSFTFSAQAASSDYYIKIGGVDGESKKTEPARATTTSSVQSSSGSTEASADYYLKIEGVNGESKPTPGVEPDEIDYEGKQETNFGVLLDNGAPGSDDEGEAKGNVEMQWKVEEGSKISVEAHELRGLDEEKKQEFLSQVKAFVEIKSGEDLENFARGILLENDELVEVQFNPKELSVSHRASGKIFGFIPVTYTEEVVASGEDGAEVDIKVKLPWWGFLISPDSDPEILAAEAKKKHKETINMDSISWGVSQHAGLLKSISDVLKTRHDTVKNSIGNIR